MKTPIVLISGYLGSGKTTLVKHLLATTDKKIAVIMNEFGDIGIDTPTIEGSHIIVKELLEGCVCCSLTGELEAALEEMIAQYKPETVLIETTGIAEPDNIIVTLRDELSTIRLDTVITVVDADTMIRFPHISTSAEIQLRSADVLVVNKTDLVTAEQLAKVHDRITTLNNRAQLMDAVYCQVDTDILLSIEAAHHFTGIHHTHRPTLEATTIHLPALNTAQLKSILHALSPHIFRAKGLLQIDGKAQLLNYVAGRVSQENTTHATGQFILIGTNTAKTKKRIEDLLHTDPQTK
ncbi:GTP-binding protein [Candidatus Woesearchaeota archaeon]|nr:GTP-binding protein [Candidatus Woesearchaeota archaeon]